MAPKRGFEPLSPPTSRTRLSSERVSGPSNFPGGNTTPSWVCGRVSVRSRARSRQSASRWAQGAGAGWLTEGMARRDRWKPGFRDLCVYQFRHFGVQRAPFTPSPRTGDGTMSLLGLGKCDHIANLGAAGQQRDEAIEADAGAADRRRAGLERIEEKAVARPHGLARQPD